MATWHVRYRPETALQDELVEAETAEVWRGEDLLVFGPDWSSGVYRRAPSIPLRFLLRVSNADTGAVVYE